MSIWVRLTALVFAVAVLAGCGGGGGGGASKSTVDAKRLLSSAPAKVENARSSRASFSISISSDQLANTITIPGKGEFDYKSREGHLTMDLSDLLSAAGQSGSGEMEMIARGDVYFVRYPQLTEALGAKTKWIKVNIADLTATTLNGVDLSSLRQLNQGDPSQTLVYLKAAGTVEQKGTEQIGSVNTTEYHATIKLDRVAKLAPADKRKAVKDSVDVLKTRYGISELPLDVWLDDQGLPRRMAYEISVKVQGQTVKTSLSMDLSDYGLKVNAQPPPANQVTDLNKLTG